MSAAPPLADPARMDGKVVVIAGSITDRSLALGRRFGQGGAHVVLASAERTAGPAQAETLRRENLSATAAWLDLLDPDKCRVGVNALVVAHGAIDVWVTMPGLRAGSGPTETLPAEAWEVFLRPLLLSPIYCAQAAGAHMLGRGRGVIIHVTSVDGDQAIDGRAAYSVAAAGLVALTRSLAVEWAGRGVRVAGVAVGPAAAGPAMAADYTRRTPLRRLATPADIAEAVYYLASDEAAFIVGETLRVDGGWTAYHLF